MWDLYAKNAEKDHPRQMELQKIAQDNYEDKLAKHRVKLHEYENRAATSKMTKPRAPNKPKEATKPRMQVGEAENFLKLSSALRLLLAPSLTLQDLDQGDRLLREYMNGFKNVRVLRNT